MNDPKIDEARLRQLRLDSLSRRTETLTKILMSLEDFIQINNIGMSDDVCDGYPFTESLDEVIAKTALWATKIEKARADACR